MTKSRKRAVYGGAAILSLVLLGWGASAYFGGPTSIPESRLATVERGSLARSVVATGKIEPISKVEIKSKANGIIKELKVDVGDLVSEGQVLAELDKENLSARLREAQAALEASQSNLKAAQAELDKNKI